MEKSAVKIAIIGSGSTYTPELIEGLINKRETLPLEELYFMDIDYQLSGYGYAYKQNIEANEVITDKVLVEFKGLY